MMELLQSVENTALAAWVRESVSLWAYPGILAAHTIGLAFLVGLSFVVDLRVLGVAPSLPLASLRGFLPVLWIGFAVNAISGVLLLIAYATSLLANPIFVIKLVLVALGVVQVGLLTREVFPREVSAAAGAPRARARWLAMAGLALWTGAILSGRMTAYLDVVADSLGVRRGG